MREKKFGWGFCWCRKFNDQGVVSSYSPNPSESIEVKSRWRGCNAAIAITLSPNASLYFSLLLGSSSFSLRLPGRISIVRFDCPSQSYRNTRSALFCQTRKERISSAHSHLPSLISDFGSAFLKPGESTLNLIFQRKWGGKSDPKKLKKWIIYKYYFCLTSSWIQLIKHELDEQPLKN